MCQMRIPSSVVVKMRGAKDAVAPVSAHPPFLLHSALTEVLEWIYACEQACVSADISMSDVFFVKVSQHRYATLHKSCISHFFRIVDLQYITHTLYSRCVVPPFPRPCHTHARTHTHTHTHTRDLTGIELDVYVSKCRHTHTHSHTRTHSVQKRIPAMGLGLRRFQKHIHKHAHTHTLTHA